MTKYELVKQLGHSKFNDTDIVVLHHRMIGKIMPEEICFSIKNIRRDANKQKIYLSSEKPKPKLIPYEDLAYKHKSDCALHNSPAEKIGDCDCGIYLDILDEMQSMIRLEEYSSLFTKEQMLNEIDWCFACNHN